MGTKPQMDSAACRAECLLRDGYVVLDGLFDPRVVQEARACVIDNIALLKNTRPNPGSGHLAGFHRHPEFAHLHTLISDNHTVRAVIAEAAGSSEIRPIGLSDITVNRSQQWHVDLLRGRYRHHLSPEICWGSQGGGLYKALLYLQSGNSLKVIPGGHDRPVPLDSDRSSEPDDETETVAVGMNAGALVLMDIRLPHCGSSEEELGDPTFLAAPKILVSTVTGAAGKPLTRAMEAGNAERLADWDALYENQRQGPRLSPRAS